MQSGGHQRGYLLRRSVPFVDRVVSGRSDVDVAGAVHSHAGGTGQLRERGHLLRGCAPLVDRVASVRGINIAGAVHSHARRIQQPRRHQRSHLLSRRAPLLDREVAGVRDVDIAGAVHSHARRFIQPRGHQCGHLLRRGGPLLDCVVLGIRDVDVAGAIHGQAKRRTQPRRHQRSPRTRSVRSDIIRSPLCHGDREPSNSQRAAACSRASERVIGERDHCAAGAAGAAGRDVQKGTAGGGSPGAAVRQCDRGSAPGAANQKCVGAQHGGIDNCQGHRYDEWAVGCGVILALHGGAKVIEQLRLICANRQARRVDRHGRLVGLIFDRESHKPGR